MEEKMVLEILQENYNHGIESIKFLRDSGGTVYIARGREQKFLLKIAGKVFWNTVRQSVGVMNYLYENGFPVPAIIQAENGKNALEITIHGQEYLFILYQYIEGEEPDLSVCAEETGKLAGQLHKLLFSYKNGMAECGYSFFIGNYIEILHKKNYPRTDIYECLGKNLWNYTKNCTTGICHCDFHRGNLLQAEDGKIYVFDFDTACIAPYMSDIAVMCDMTDYFDLRHEDIQKTMDVYKNFLEGYACYKKLAENEKDSFSYWIAIRHFQLQAVIVQIYGLDCIDNNFIDRQLEWLRNWCRQQCSGIVL